jgi:hypothetical protein
MTLRGFGIRRMFLTKLIVFLEFIFPNRVLTGMNWQIGSTGQTSVESEIISLANVRIYSSRNKYLILGTDAKNLVVYGWGPGGTLSQKQKASLPYALLPTRILTRPVMISNFVAAETNLYHFYLHNILPYMWAKYTWNIPPERVLLFLKRPTLYQQYVMEILNISWTFRKNAVCCVDLKVILLTRKVEEKSIAYFREKLNYSKLKFEAQKESSPVERVYLARRNRMPSNHGEIEKISNEYGYTTIYLEDLTAREQINLVCGVSHWIAGHGAGLVHLVWGTPKSLIELVPILPDGSEFGDGCFERLFLGISPQGFYEAMKFTLMADSDLRGEEEKKGSDSHGEISLEQLRRSLKKIHA